MKSSEITVVESAALGFWLPVLTRAVLKSVGTTPEEASWNILQANGMYPQLVCMLPPLYPTFE